MFFGNFCNHSQIPVKFLCKVQNQSTVSVRSRAVGIKSQHVDDLITRITLKIFFYLAIWLCSW